MKMTIIFTSVAIATLFAFSSCQKENLENNGPESSLRIITAEFENNATKTTLNEDGKTPEWEVGDVIRVLNGSTYQDVEIISGSGEPESGKAYISGSGLKIGIPGTMTGTLYAVYPASATTMTSCDGSINFTIPAIQDGTFSSANICVAKSSTEDGTNKENLVFRNATAVLKIKTAADVVGVDVTAANSIAGPVTASFEGTTLSLTTSFLDKKYVSAVGTSAPSGNVFYLATAPVITGSATVNCYKTDKKGSESKSSKELAKNTIYSMDLSSMTIDNTDLTGQHGILNGHEYVIIKAKYDGTNDSYRKWATMNVGATTVAGNYETCYGDLYWWGSVETIYTDRPWTSATGGSFSSKWKEGINGYGYSWSNYCGISSFKEWKTVPYNATTKILKSEYDAATQNWGTGWRMPTSAEFLALYKACGKTGTYITSVTGGTKDSTTKDIYWCSSYNGVAGLLFITIDNGPHLFFPAAGYGNGSSLTDAGSYGAYWSSSVLDSHSNAYSLSFRSNNVSAQNYRDRYYGFPVRPVSD